MGWSELAIVPHLRPGDAIAVVAPAGPVPISGRLQKGIDRLKQYFRVKVAEDIYRREGFLAGSDSRRAEEFNHALRNPDVRAIWAARGGYGASRITSLLDKDALRRDPKIIVGFSDITTLLHWAAAAGLRSMHGPVVTQLADLCETDWQWAVDMVMGKLDGALWASGICGSEDKAEGRLLGGNLCLLSHLCGTDLAPDYSGSLCVIEDVNEPPYAIDRYLTQLLTQQNGSLSNANAVLVGDLIQHPDSAHDSLTAIAVARHRIKSYGIGIPCYHGLPIGHGPRNRAFPFGGHARMSAGNLWLVDSLVSASF